MNSVKKPLLLSVKQIDSTDQRFNIFESERTGYHFTDTIIVQKSAKGYRIVYGFEILTANLDSDDKFPAFCFSEKVPLTEIVKIIIEVQRRKRELYPIERARIIDLVRQSGVSDGDIIQNIFPLLDLKPDLGVITNYRHLRKLSEPMIRYLIDKHAPAKTWLSLARFNLHDTLLLDKFIELAPTLSIFEEIATSLFEISVREQISYNELQESLHWDDMLNNHDLEKKKHIRQIREAVTKRRYPKLSAHRERVGQILKQIPLPENATLNFDETFEKKELRIIWRLNTPADIKRMQAFYNNANFRRLKDLLSTL